VVAVRVFRDISILRLWAVCKAILIEIPSRPTDRGRDSKPNVMLEGRFVISKENWVSGLHYRVKAVAFWARRQKSFIAFYSETISFSFDPLLFSGGPSRKRR